MLATLDPFAPSAITLRNHANAAHSTGPRTPEGRAIVSRNATKHGLFSNARVATAFEQQADWEAHLASYYLCLDPLDHPEYVLAERIAFLHWRRARLAHYENAMIDANLQAFEDRLQEPETLAPAIPPDAAAQPFDYPTAAASPKPRKLTPEQVVVQRATCVLPDGKVMDRIMRYDAQISKDLERSQTRLDQLKATRAQRHRRALRQSTGYDGVPTDLLLREEPPLPQFAHLDDDPGLLPFAAPAASTACEPHGSVTDAESDFAADPTPGDSAPAVAGAAAPSTTAPIPLARRATGSATKQSQMSRAARRRAASQHAATGGRGRHK